MNYTSWLRGNPKERQKIVNELKAAYQAGLPGISLKDFDSRENFIKALISKKLVRSLTDIVKLTQLVVVLERHGKITPMEKLRRQFQVKKIRGMMARAKKKPPRKKRMK